MIKSAPWAPGMNAHGERVIGSLRREVLDHILVMGGAHARQVLAACQRHHHEHRPPGAQPTTTHAQKQPTAIDSGARRLLRTRVVLGGLISEYRNAA
ncbi:hypothetical protein WJ438_39655 [Streptomyces sp. GD-15H]|uniref:hypothetical protein n=1 Tax=Streptomyces sp. GD-15H TaxID=3129112 RepID=UPI003255B947